MKTAFLGSVLCALALFSGCSEKKEANPATPGQKAAAMNDAISNNSSGSVLSAPADYLGAAVKAKQNAVKTIDVTSLNSSIQQFYAGEGRFPKDLQEVVSKKYITQIPAVPVGMKLQYDANAGEVKMVRE
jgi:hypothetical protein